MHMFCFQCQETGDGPRHARGDFCAAAHRHERGGRTSDDGREMSVLSPSARSARNRPRHLR